MKVVMVVDDGRQEKRIYEIWFSRLNFSWAYLFCVKSPITPIDTNPTVKPTFNTFIINAKPVINNPSNRFMLSTSNGIW